MSSERVKAFGREVRRRRLALDMSLETLAEGAGLSGPYVGAIEAAGVRVDCHSMRRSAWLTGSGWSFRSCLASTGSRGRASKRAASSRRCLRSCGRSCSHSSVGSRSREAHVKPRERALRQQSTSLSLAHSGASSD